MIRLLLAIGLALSCTKKKESTNESSVPISMSCNQQQTAEACRATPDCLPESGIDVTTKEEVFMGCLNAFSDSLRCHSPVSCFINSAGQRVVREKSCSFEKWTEVSCTESEKKIPSANPCDVMTPAACTAENKCSLRSARDVVTREWVTIGCVREGEICGSAIWCYTNAEHTRRVIDTAVCRTFPEWESTPCQPEDMDALQLQ